MDDQPLGANAGLLVQQNRRPEAPPEPEETSLHLEGEVALLLQIAMLQNSVVQLEKVPSYTATFLKNERIEGELLGEQVMQLKLRHEPLSVYFKVEQGDVGREILYPVAADDPRMIVKLPKFGFRLPPLKLEPTSALAMKEARYPITTAGIKELAKLALEFRRRDLKLGNKVAAEVRDDQQFDGRPCFSFSVTYSAPVDGHEYRKCIIYIDRQLMIPVFAKNFTWPEKVADADVNRLDDTTLLELYAFRNIQFDKPLEAKEFLVDNPEYRFRN